MTPKLFFLFTFTLLASSVSSQTCLRSCGRIPLRYPFGIGGGCGDPRYQSFLSDPSMSTCACNQPSKGFSLDYDAPFTFTDDNIFTLLNCSTDSSPIFHGGSNTSFPLCDKQGSPICSYLYSCNAISMLNLPISTCCVYTPVDLGPAFEMDLEKLKCASYSAFFSFNGQQSNPENWKYGIALKYKYSVYDDSYPRFCADCEKSNGVCGMAGAYNSFFCNCQNGINTTSTCFFVQSYNDGVRLLPWQAGIFLFAWLLKWVLL